VTASTILEISGVAKRFGGLRAVDDVNLVVAAGEKRAVIGPNGAGKTTLFNLVTGRMKPDEGTVRFDGEDITGWPPHQITRAGIGRAFQITSIFPRLTVFESIQLAILAHRRETPRLIGVAKARHTGAVTEIIELVGLGAVARETSGELSHGDQRALELALALALEPKLLLLDEPTAGMAPAETEQAMALVRRVAAERRLTVLFCEHDMDVVFGTADRIFVMDRGTGLAEGTPAEIRSNEAVRAVYLGTDE
jgi:branched-chain amino acid transport system ATP-binding protein